MVHVRLSTATYPQLSISITESVQLARNYYSGEFVGSRLVIYISSYVAGRMQSVLASAAFVDGECTCVLYISVNLFLFLTKSFMVI